MVFSHFLPKEIYKKLTDGWCRTGSSKKIVKECINIVIWFQFGTIKVSNLLSMAEFFHFHTERTQILSML